MSYSVEDEWSFVAKIFAPPGGIRTRDLSSRALANALVIALSLVPVVALSAFSKLRGGNASDIKQRIVVSVK
jgi:hypothetical protein